ncbi:MAG: hypothetical protein Q8P63_02095 [Candidatus Nealsonbacteria bacterium]|nr:hypothetical protein [Candidatus Nealsonbacteria bacterium]
MAQKLRIIAGPGMYGLLIRGLGSFLEVTFTVQAEELEGSIEGEEVLTARINALTAKESTRQEWYIEGLLDDGRKGCREFRADYSLSKNKGWMEIILS